MLRFVQPLRVATCASLPRSIQPEVVENRGFRAASETARENEAPLRLFVQFTEVCPAPLALAVVTEWWKHVRTTRWLWPTKPVQIAARPTG